MTTTTRSRRLTPEQRQSIPELYLAGLTYKRVAEQVSCGSGTARKYVLAAGIQPRNRTITDAEGQEIFRLYRMGYSKKHVAELMGRSAFGITNYMRNATCGTRRGRQRGERLPEAVRLAIPQRYRTGLSAVRIADELGIAVATVCNHLRKNGIDPQEEQETRTKFPPRRMDTSYRPRTSVEKQQQIVDLGQTGRHLIGQIATLVGCGAEIVKRVLVLHGIPITSHRGRPRKEYLPEAAKSQEKVLLEGLRNEERSVYELFGLKMTYEDIAHALQIPMGTVKSRLNRARRILNELAAA